MKSLICINSSRLVLIFFFMSLLSCKTSHDETQLADDISELSFMKGWQLVSSDSVNADGALLSNADYDLNKGYEIEIPATVMAALNREKVYGDIFSGENLKNVDTAPFDVPWWYRKTFNLNLDNSDFYRLRFEGINYKANIWLNGELIASADTVEGVFRMFEFDVTKKMVQGENALAIEVIPPKWGDLTIGFVDWNPWPPDDNLGIWRPVKLIKTHSVAIKSLFVKPDLNTETLEEASIQIVAEIQNLDNNDVNASLDIEFEGVSISHPISLKANESKSVVLSAAEYPTLIIQKPRIWWPNNMGDPNMYAIKAQITANDLISDTFSTNFGIRKIEDYFTEKGYRGYKINGKEILIKGGGWVDDIFLDDTDQKVEDQVKYVKHMNLNTIRLEGFWGKNKRLFELADEHGILIMIGWSCQWEWTDYSGREEEDEYLQIRTDEEIIEHTRAYQDQMEWLMNHPSVFLWVYGSDKLLVPKLETSLNNLISSTDGTRPILNSCGSKISEVTGKSGVKMSGPYSYVTPNYWYVDKERGGAFGFNTETGPGLQIAPIESIRKMIPEENMWPMDSVWGYHLGRREFTTFRHWMKPFEERYGMEDNVEAFAHKAQMANYEAMRAMFEAFHINRPNTTGIIQWMLNSAWPAMIWQLYDYYLMPNGAYYATKKASAPLNIAYNYADNGVYITNENAQTLSNSSAQISMYDTKGKALFVKSVALNGFDSASKKIMELPSLAGLSTTYFVDLRIINEEKQSEVINFYWLSTKEDVLDLENSDWYVTGNKEYADLKGINSMDSVAITSSYTTAMAHDLLMVEATLENPSDMIAFFIELSIKDEISGETILPVAWDDNYISLLPGEKRTVKGYVSKENIQSGKVNFSYLGWNVK